MRSHGLRATAFGLLAGLLIGTLGWVVLVSAFLWDDRRRMSDLSEEPAYLAAVWARLTDGAGLPFGAAVATLAAVNGAVGGWAAQLTGGRGVIPVLAVALTPLLFPVAVYAENPGGGSKWWGGAFVVALFVIPFVWVAGRVGQELGARQRHAEPGAAPDPARMSVSGNS